MNLIVIIVISLIVLFILREMVVHNARMVELVRLNELADAGHRVTEQLDNYEQYSRFLQVVDLRKWTHKQFFGE
jgi:hypothetical protein